MKPVPADARHAYDAMPGSRHTAAAIGNEGVHAVGSAFLIGWLEEACHRLLLPFYEDGEATVGTGFDLQHVAPAYAGRPVTCRASLASRGGRTLTFSVSAEQDGRTVMEGRHVRVLVDRVGFATRAAADAAAPPGPTLTFWFDVHSPWCFLAALRIGDIARAHRSPLQWRPLHLPTLIDAIGGRRPLEENEAFVRWYRQDLDDQAALAGVQVQYHPRYPLRNSRALRACAWAESLGRGEAFTQRLLRGYWTEEAADISDPPVLASMAEEVGLDGAAIPEVIADPARRQSVSDNTEEAIRAGVFGVPTVACEGRLFFGNDRLEALDRWLSGRTG